MVGLCFVDSLHLTQAGVQATQGALFMLVTENTFGPMYAMLSLFPTELPLFLRHHRAGLYGPLAYYMAKIIAIVSITDECRRSPRETCLPARGCVDCSGIFGSSQVMSFPSSQGGRNLTPSTSLMYPSDSPLAVTNRGFCAPEAAGKQVPRCLYYKNRRRDNFSDRFCRVKLIPAFLHR